MQAYTYMRCRRSRPHGHCCRRPHRPRGHAQEGDQGQEMGVLLLLLLKRHRCVGWCCCLLCYEMRCVGR